MVLPVHCREHRSQGFVTLYDLVKVLLERRHIEQTRKVDNNGNIVNYAAGFKLFQQP